MKFPIGFNTEYPAKPAEYDAERRVRHDAPRKSLVKIHFSQRNTTLAYYNDRFDLRAGDLVFVDGKLEGFRGQVVEVNYNFKIKAEVYKRVIALADTRVHGRFHMAGSHFVTFDRSALPFEQVRTWFCPPDNDVVYVSGSDDTSFPLSELTAMGVTPAIAERGRDYYMDNKVVYLSIDSGRGRAIVEGTKPYIVEFRYNDGQISELVCDCFCSGTCKHQFAAMLQLRETLETIEKEYPRHSGEEYFAAISKPVLFAFVVDGSKNGSLDLDT